MKYILTLLCFGVLSAYGQEPAYTPMRLNYQFRGIKVDSLFLIPSFNDTTAANSSTMKNVAGAMIRTGNDFYMRNATTNAWLQNVNVGTGASPSVQFVDSIWRVAGKDSIFWRKGGVSNKIKDSTGSIYAGDSPDRIDGTATDNINARLGVWTMTFNGSNAGTIQADFVLDSIKNIYLRSDSIVFDGYNTSNADVVFKDLKRLSTSTVDIIDMTATSALALGSSDSTRISGGNKIDIGLGNRRHITQGNKYEFKDFNNTFFRIDTLGNFEAGDLTKDSLTFSLLRSGNEIVLKSKATPVWREQNNGISMYLKVTRGANGIDLTGGNYTARVPGVYVISDATSSDFVIPDANDWPGQTITIINTDAAAANLTCNNNLFDKGTGNTINSIATTEMIIFVSDGSDWYGAIQ